MGQSAQAHIAGREAGSIRVALRTATEPFVCGGAACDVEDKVLSEFWDVPSFDDIEYGVEYLLFFATVGLAITLFQLVKIPVIRHGEELDDLTIRWAVTTG